MDSSPFVRGIMCCGEGLGFNKLNKEEAEMDATTVAVDLAKDVFEVAMANRVGRILERTRLTRRQFEAFIDALPVGTRVVMEACGTAHYWGRRCQPHGHDVQLLPVQYVKPYVRRNKTDRMDTEALLEAARCAGIQPVPVKTPEHQVLSGRRRRPARPQQAGHRRRQQAGAGGLGGLARGTRLQRRAAIACRRITNLSTEYSARTS
jgi:transposase